MKKALSLVLALMMLMTMCVVPVHAAESDGSAENPYYVTKPMMAPGLITIPANSAVYYQYRASLFAGWEVGGLGLSAITVDGVVFDKPDMWGEIYAPLDFSFLSAGVVGFVNDTDEEIEVALTHKEPVGTDNNPDTLSDGKNDFTIPGNVYPYTAIYVPMVNGEYTFSCDQTEDFYITIDCDGDFEDDEYELLDGSLTVELESYVPVKVCVSPMGITPDVSLTITAPKRGSEDNPIWVSADSLEESYVLSGTDPMYFHIDGSLSGNSMIIESANGTGLTIELDGEEYVAEYGALELPLESYDFYMELIVYQDEDSDNELFISIEYVSGNEFNPIVLESGDNTVSVPEDSQYYYAYTATAAGLLVVTPADTSVIGYLDIYYEDAEENIIYGYLPEGAPAAFVPVPVGQTVRISVTGVMDEETWINQAVDTVLNIEVKDLLVYNDFESGDLEGWSSSSDLVLEEIGEESHVANGFYSAEFNVTNDWGNIYQYVKVEPNTTYDVTFKAKALVADKGMWIKFNQDWSDDVDSADVALSTEWTERTVSLTSNDSDSLILLMQYAGYAADGQVIWLDDIIITKAAADDEPEVPDVPDAPIGSDIVNGNFENGDEGWKLGDGASIADDNGNGVLKLENPGQWSEAAMQDVAVEPGTTYTVSWKSKRVSGAGAFNLFLMDGDNANCSVDGAYWMNSQSSDWVEHSVKVAATHPVLRLKFSTESGNPGVILIDDVKVTANPKPVIGQILNGDFETGDLTGWESWQSTAISTDAAHSGSYGAQIKGNGGWGGMLNQTFAVEPGKSYELSFWYKVNNNGFNMQFNGVQTSNSYASTWTQQKEWTLFTQAFTVDTDTEIKINFCGGGNGIAEDAYIDDIKIIELKDPSNDGFILNGDFEAGNATPWNIYGTESGVIADAAHSGEFGLMMVSKGDWGGTGDQEFAIEPGKTYVVNLWIKTIKNGVNVQIQDNGSTVAGDWVNNASEWTKKSYEFTATSTTGKINFCGGGNNIHTVVYVDDIEVVELKEPSVDDGFVNGDFEAGSMTGWDTYQNTVLSKDAAHCGAYGANLLGEGGWGAMLEQTTLPLVAGKTYEFSFWYKANAVGANWTLKQNDQTLIAIDGENMVSGWIDQGEWTQVSVSFVAPADGEAVLNFCGGGTGVAEDLYVDCISMVAAQEPEEPAVILGDVNGDGKVNNRDLGLLQRVLNGIDIGDQTYNEKAADVNEDGKLNNRDLGMLQRLLNGIPIA